MKSNTGVSLSSSPCYLSGLPDKHVDKPAAQAQLSLINGLSRVFGIHLNNDSNTPDHQFLSGLSQMFQQQRVEAEQPLERHDKPWENVYLVQYGILRLFREAPSGKTAIHHFFTEGDMVWPVFARSRTARNTLCLTSVTPATLWVADFSAFRAALQSHGEGVWSGFALALIEELAELTSMREFRKQTLAARERYALLLEEYPELIKRVPDNQLASWLGVVPATYSRIKTALRTGQA
ncbi:Crp/Fnr family transcriptional regulator [Marinobacter sp.]|uniref:Crp/Fnr family transcriptional regulator n=1 Tax=Marinobacter sp. TaxID=50741 RepID=UPI0034A4639B